jgi:hypothetical protein
MMMCIDVMYMCIAQHTRLIIHQNLSFKLSPLYIVYTAEQGQKDDVYGLYAVTNVSNAFLFIFRFPSALQ